MLVNLCSSNLCCSWINCISRFQGLGCEHLWGGHYSASHIICLVVSPFLDNRGCEGLFCRAKKKLIESERKLDYLSYLFASGPIKCCRNDYLARGTKLFWLFLTQRTIKSKNTRAIKTRLMNSSVQLFCF